MHHRATLTAVPFLAWIAAPEIAEVGHCNRVREIAGAVHHKQQGFGLEQGPEVLRIRVHQGWELHKPGPEAAIRAVVAQDTG